MPTVTRLLVACNTCEEIGPRIQTGAQLRLTGEPGRPKRTAAEARVDWSIFLDNHGGHDVRLIVDGYDPIIPLHGWMPRPTHGPPVTGRHYDQVVACPDCRGIYKARAHERALAAAGAATAVPGAQVGGRFPDATNALFGGDIREPLVLFKTVDSGADWFWFCTGCRNVWGPAADKAMVRAELGGVNPAETLWPLQRQGISEGQTIPDRTGRRT